MHLSQIGSNLQVGQDDGSRIVCRLKQTCTPTGVHRKWVTTVTDVMMLNHAVSLDVARDGTQCNTQGVWPSAIWNQKLISGFKYQMVYP